VILGAATARGMGSGTSIGAGLRQAREEGQLASLHSGALIGRMLDGLGDDVSLRGPLRDLASRPLFLRLLGEAPPSERQAAALALSQELADTYTPRVLAELLDLIEAAAALELPRPEPPRPEQAAASVPPHARRSAARPVGLRAWIASWRPLAPGLLLAFCMALVLRWLGGELQPFWPAGWGSGWVLAAALALVQLLALLPLRRWRRQAPLRLHAASDPQRAWCWFTAPWLHRGCGETLWNLAILVLLLGVSPLPIGSVLMRFSLTALACLALAVHHAHGRLQACSWQGASGAVAALIAMAATVSLLQGRVITFPLGNLEVPAWVLLLLNGAVQSHWLLQRRDPLDPAPARAWLLSSSWCWGTALGVLWALLNQALALATPLLQGSGR